MTTAFVLSGGGSLGAVQVGMLQALAERGVEPDMLLGTSAGAVNAAWVADRGTGADSLAGLVDVWTRLRRKDVFPVAGRQVLSGISGLSPAVCSNTPLRLLVDAHVRAQDLRETSIPLYIVATDVLTGRETLISDGPLTTAVLASAAVPGLLPPVAHHDRFLIDGGVADGTGVSSANGLGADVIYVLPGGSACALPQLPRGAIGVALHALTLLMQQRLAHEIRLLAGSAHIKILPPLCPLSVSPASFGHAAELIRRGRESAAAWLDTGGTERPRQDRYLSLHDHGESVPGPASAA
jgi:NTE family protein